MLLKTLYDEQVKKVSGIQPVDPSDLVKNTNSDDKIKDIEHKIPNDSVYITTNDVQYVMKG